ncbi:MAG: hypothetical protein ACRDCA_12665 [Serratia sp. (in: enterobacteria)]
MEQEIIVVSFENPFLTIEILENLAAYSGFDIQIDADKKQVTFSK